MKKLMCSLMAMRFLRPSGVCPVRRRHHEAGQHEARHDEARPDEER